LHNIFDNLSTLGRQESDRPFRSAEFHQKEDCSQCRWAAASISLVFTSAFMITPEILAITANGDAMVLCGHRCAMALLMA
jgi:hypothetical protein